MMIRKQLTETVSKLENLDSPQMMDLYNRQIKENGLCQTLDTGYHNSTRLYQNKRIRKLTPRECFRLMGVNDNDFDKIAKNQTDASLYHLAGDSIVVDVLKEIFKELL